MIKRLIKVALIVPVSFAVIFEFTYYVFVWVATGKEIPNPKSESLFDKLIKW